MGPQFGMGTKILAGLLATVACAGGAQAQSRGVAPGNTASDQQQGGDIVVTAEKRVQRISDVPYAITAVTGDEITARGSVDIKDLQASIPSLSIIQLQPGRDRITLRGVDAGTGTGVPTTGVYVDEVSLTGDQQSRDLSFPLVDIARIEVLRGPQGTLYGQGSMAGTIRYITQDPSLTSISGFAEGNIYQQEQGGVGYRLNGAVGMPIVTDKVGIRVSGGYDHLAGWIDYPTVGRTDANGSRRWFIRPKILIKPTEALTISLLYQYLDLRADSDSISGFNGTERRGSATLYPYSDRSHLANAIISYDFGGVSLTSATGYQNRRFPGTFSSGPLFIVQDEREEIFTEEVRLSSSQPGPLQYTLGGFYRRGLTSIDRVVFLNGAATTIARRVGTDPANSRSFAVFGQGSYDLTSRLQVLIGARYYWDTRTTGATIPVEAERSAKFNAFSPKATIRLAINDDSSIYATVSKGFRSGGFNSAGPASYGPESLWNYEFGTKLSFFGGDLFLDLAGYYAEYNNRQSQSLVPILDANGNPVPNSFFNVTTNAGRAAGPGLEGSLVAKLPAGLRLTGTASYSDVVSRLTTVEITKGERFKFVPSFSGSLSLSQDIPLSDKIRGFWRADFQHISPYEAIYRSVAGTPPVPTVLENFKNSAQNYVNLRAGIEVSRFTITADVTNLTNENEIIYPNSPILATQEAVRARPRSYGLTVRTTF